MFFWIAQSMARRRAAKSVIDLDPLTTEIVSAERLLSMFEKERDNIESVKVLVGTLGSDDFGSFVVHRKRPIYAPSFDEALAGR